MNIDLIFKIAAIGILIAVLNQLLVRAGRDDIALLTTIAGLVIVLLMVVDLVSNLFESVKKELPEFAVSTLEQWFEQGSLASRIKVAYSRDKDLKGLYKQLGKCLQTNHLFTPT